MEQISEIDGIEYDRDLPLFDGDHFSGVFDPENPDARKSLLLEIFGLFREECGSRVEAVERFFGQAADTVYRENIHFIAGSAANLGMARLAGLCRGVEQAIIVGRTFDLSACRVALRREYESSCEAFSADPLVR